MTRLAAIFLGVCLALLPTSAMAISFGFSASYEEDGTTTGTNPDFYSFTNDVLSETQILEIVLDLSGGLAVYDPIGAPFQLLGGDAVGFDGSFTTSGSTLLTLVFTDFDPGEIFLFGVETDDSGGGFTTGADFAGAVATVTWVNGIAPPSLAIFTVDPGNSDRAVASNFTATPEPGTFVLLAMGLVGLSLTQRRQRS